MRPTHEPRERQSRSPAARIALAGAPPRTIAEARSPSTARSPPALRTALAAAIPAQRLRAAHAARGARACRITARPAREAPRSSPDRSRPRRRAPRPTERRRARSVVEDLLRRDRTHAGQRVELLERRCAQAHAARGGTRRPAPVAGAACDLPRHEHLLPVCERRGEVHRLEKRLRRRPAGPLERVRDARPVGEPVEPGRRTAPRRRRRRFGRTAGPARDAHGVSRRGRAPSRDDRASARRAGARLPSPRTTVIACRREIGNDDTLSIVATTCYVSVPALCRD